MLVSVDGAVSSPATLRDDGLSVSGRLEDDSDRSTSSQVALSLCPAVGLLAQAVCQFVVRWQVATCSEAKLGVVVEVNLWEVCHDLADGRVALPADVCGSVEPNLRLEPTTNSGTLELGDVCSEQLRKLCAMGEPQQRLARATDWDGWGETAMSGSVEAGSSATLGCLWAEVCLLSDARLNSVEILVEPSRSGLCVGEPASDESGDLALRSHVENPGQVALLLTLARLWIVSNGDDFVCIASDVLYSQCPILSAVTDWKLSVCGWVVCLHPPHPLHVTRTQCT